MSSHERELQVKAYRGELRWLGGEWVEHEPYDEVKREDRVNRMKREVELPAEIRELPDARDVLPEVSRVEMDRRKFSDYSLNPDHPQNHGKAEGWRALGYDVDDPDARREAARDLDDLICHGLLANGKVEKTRETRYGPSHTVLSGFIGPNDRHATLVTCWLVEDTGDRGVPKMTTTWVQPHKNKEGQP